MQYNVGDVSRMFQVAENVVARWVENENLPAELVNAQYRFERSELLEWAAIKKLRFSPEMFHQVNGDTIAELSVGDSLKRGGIAYQVPGGDRRSALSSVVGGLPLPDSFDRDMLLQLFLAREHLGTTAVGDGIAIPHPRVPVILPTGEPAIHLAFLKEGVDFRAMDSKPVTVMFAMVCPTVHEHLQLLAKLSLVLQDPRTRNVIAQQAAAEEILDAIRSAEISVPQAAVAGGRA